MLHFDLIAFFQDSSCFKLFSFRAPELATYGDETSKQMEVESLPPVPPVVNTTTAAILPRLKDFHDLLLNPPQVRQCAKLLSLKSGGKTLIFISLCRNQQ